MTEKPEKLTDFGYQTVTTEEKTEKVAEVFHSVASKYDLMNDLMSLGMHRLWKRFFTRLAMAKPGHRILDLAGGTGDISLQFAKTIREKGTLILSDINESMLKIGRNKLIDNGFVNNIEYIQANAEFLPFQNNEFDLITIAFGLRNVTFKESALKEMFRTLKPGGKALVLEFSKPQVKSLSPLYDFYSMKILPKLGQWIAKDSASYQYLAESIRRHPDQETLKIMMKTAGFDEVQVHNLSAGIVAVHIGYKY